MIDLTPLEVRKKKGDFRRIMRGYDPALVDDFLDLVADRLEELVRENLMLNERAGKQDHQVGEYRDREKALTEALVSAQQMREEIRKQSAREAEVAKQAAETETSQFRAAVRLEVEALRASAEQEVRELREAARRESQEAKAAAQREANELKAAAQREAQELHESSQRESVQLRTKITREREREEEEYRRLRKRQEQFLTSYHAFLERELTELTAFSRELGLTRETEAAEASAAPKPAPSAAKGKSAAAAPLLETSAASEENFASLGDDPELLDLAFAEPVDASDDVGVTDALEPFQPEPIEPEDLTVNAPPPANVNELDALLGSLSTEEEPRPIDLGPHGWAAPPEWNLPNLDLAEPAKKITFGNPVEPPANTISFGNDAEPPAPKQKKEKKEKKDEDEDEDTTLLLRNAEAAGYHVDDLDDSELLLEEKLPADKKKDDDGWLPSLLEDDK